MHEWFCRAKEDDRVVSTACDTMIEATFGRADTLKRIVDGLKLLMKSTNFECSEEGIAMQGMDSTHVALCAFLLKSSGFQEYRCSRDAILGLDLKTMATVMGTVDGAQQLVLSSGESEGKVVIKAGGAGGLSSQFDLATLHITSMSYSLPDMTYPGKVTMPSATFVAIMKNLQVLQAESVVMTLTKEGMVFRAAADSGDITYKLDSNDGDVHFEVEQDISSTYTLSFLAIFAKSASLSNCVTLSIHTSAPLVVEYLIDGGDSGYLRFYLAPKESGGSDYEGSDDDDSDMSDDN